MTRLHILLFSLLSLLGFALGLGQKTMVAFRPGPDTLFLGGASAQVRIIVDSQEWKGVIRTAKDLAADFGRVTGVNGSVTVSESKHGTGSRWADFAGGVVIAGTIGKSRVIDALIQDGKIDASSIEGEWEAFRSQVVNSPLPGVGRALVIAGADKRGTIYGLYDVSEQIGVSPWYYWADVPSKTHDAIYALPTTKTQGAPTVKYRGFFLNDEAPALTGWVNAKFPPSPYGPGYTMDFYHGVFELLLRLRANYIWPAGADWGQQFFVDDPMNQPMADEMGIVVGTSHTEPMMRATNEWNLFGEGAWQWNTNNASIIPFLREGVERARPYESVVTMGMRGSGDTALGPTIQTELLEDVVEAQRAILADVHGRDEASRVPQVWCLYKEVQGYYEAGMTVPDDITLLWADDNWGNIRRLPQPGERARPGGAGVYFHFDYVGDPRDYKWVNTVNLAKTWEQMHLAYRREATRIWVVNVGDLKPLEIPISHFFDLAYDFDRWGPASEAEWLRLWAAREFGHEAASDTAEVLHRYSLLAGRRKYELLDPAVYSVVNYEEADRVLAEWDDLAARAQDIYDDLDADTRPAFFEMALHPILGGAAVYDVHISAARNNLWAGQGRNSANVAAQHMLDRLNDDHKLTKRYNTLLDGKWEHMMDQTHMGYVFWQQPMRQVTPPVQYVQTLERSLRGDIGVTTEGTNASIPGDDVWHQWPNPSDQLTMLPLDPYRPGPAYIDIFHAGVDAVDWAIRGGDDARHLRFSRSRGTLAPGDPDVRVYVTVDWPAAPAGSSSVTVNITSSGGYGAQFGMPRVTIPLNKTAVPGSFTAGFVESDRTLAFEAAHFSRITGRSASSSERGQVGYVVLPGYGRTHSGVTLLPATAPAQKANAGSPALEFDFFAFTGAAAANITAVLGTGLNADPARPLRYAVAVDDGAPREVVYIKDQPAGATPAGWDQAMREQAWTSTTTAEIGRGAHVLRFWALEPAVVLQRLVVDFGGVRRSFLGPPESVRVGEGEGEGGA